MTLPKTMLSRPILVSLLALVACAKKGVPSDPVLESVRYRIQMTAQFDTSGVDADAALPSALDALDGIEKRYDIVVSLGFVRRFRDDSQGHLFQFERFADVTDGDSPTGLAGRSVELRRFSNGEILAIDLVEHIVGGDRQGEVFDLLFPVISPSPPDLDEGAVARRSVRWPVTWGSRLGWGNVVSADWRHEGMDDRDGERMFHLSYEGAWRSSLQRPREQGIAHADGTARGETWWKKDDLSLIAHQFDWERTVEIDFPDAPGGALTVAQVQRFSGSLERLP